MLALPGPCLADFGSGAVLQMCWPWPPMAHRAFVGLADPQLQLIMSFVLGMASSSPQPWQR
jgi:hypothetical protein